MVESIENLNWYPGHMKKTRELIALNLKLVDLVVEVCDSRIPISSRNPIIEEIIKEKPKILVLGKKDLADETVTNRWLSYYDSASLKAIALNNNSGSGINQLLMWFKKKREALNENRRLDRPLRIMIVGVPNSGKSSLINRLTGKKSTMTGDRPGVTKGKQWLSIEGGTLLLDTPGILWPKFEDPLVGLNLAFCGSIKDEIMDLPELAFKLLKTLLMNYKDLIVTRFAIDKVTLNRAFDKSEDYDIDESILDELERFLIGTDGLTKAIDCKNIDNSGDTVNKTTINPAIKSSDSSSISNRAILLLMDTIARNRGLLRNGGLIDYERMARMFLDEFRSGSIGKISLEYPIY